MPSSILIYLHGFLSSPQSAKAQQLAQFLQAPTLFLKAQSGAIDYRVPALPEEPQLALHAAEQALLQARTQAINIGLIGSSMGGFYATILAERYGVRTVLVNPSVRPHLRWPRFLLENGGGEIVNPYSQRRFTLDESDIADLAAMAPAMISHPENYWLLAQEGDEVLDYRDAVEFYAGCRQTIEPGGDHQFQGFERHLPALVNFLQ